MTTFTIHDSPVGALLLTTDGTGLTGLHFPPHDVDASWEHDEAAFADVIRQLDEYFAGVRTEFDIPLHPTGTPFQLKVWEQLREIPYGETISYGALARRVASPNASRAVGLANGRNPIAIIIPCHRVIGANGSLTGYGGGLDRKRFLLGLEVGADRLL
jgi:methylated-DNA-[protein]-cysteine S-methyltransferase